MSNKTTRRLYAIAAAAALLAAACSSGDTGELSPTMTAPTTAETVPMTDAEVSPVTSAAPAATEAEPSTSTQPPVTEPDVGTERWTAVEMDVTQTSGGAFEGVVALAVQRPEENIVLMPVSVGVTLFGPWRDCEIDSESWQADFAPAVHPRLDGRAWNLQLESADVIEDDGDATVRVEYSAFGGDATATLVVTAGIVAGCGDEAQDEDGDAAADSTETQTVDSAPVESDDADDGEEDEGETAEDSDESADDKESTEDEEVDEAEVTEPEPQPVQFRRWNHQALIDLPLWAHCPPETPPQAVTNRLNGFDLTWANWDAESVELGGYHVASGWWTDEQLDRWLPGAGVTAEMAYEHAAYHPIMDTVGLWPDTIAPTGHEQTTPASASIFRAAMQHRGHNLDSFADMLRATREGIAGSGAWPEHIRPGRLLTDWMQWRYAQPPTTQEPIAWPLRSLFEARESGCAAEALIAMCASGETPSPLLASDHPIGRVLRSLACGE